MRRLIAEFTGTGLLVAIVVGSGIAATKFSIQILIAVAVTVGIAMAVTIAITVAGVLFQRDKARAARASRPGTTSAAEPTVPDARELVLR